jgi:glutamate/tyrosine decarboxylase-like PLP-dependent enzyme
VQYYNFIRLGKDGFYRTFDNLFHIYHYLAGKLEATGEAHPVVRRPA